MSPLYLVAFYGGKLVAAGRDEEAVACAACHWVRQYGGLPAGAGFEVDLFEVSRREFREAWRSLPWAMRDEIEGLEFEISLERAERARGVVL